MKLIILIIIGFYLLIKGADFLVDGASKIAKKIGISELIIGLTIVSIGTSMPEMFVSVTSAISGYSDVSIGNVIGSNLCNLLLILGFTTTIKNIKFANTTKYIEIPFMIITVFIFFILAQNEGFSRVNGLILIVLFIIFIIYTILSSNRNQNIKEKSQVTESILKCIINIVIGIVALKFGGELVVNNVKLIAQIFGVSDKIISVTIIAIGTSLPELVTSVFASIKGNTDIAIGNIIGSNIFNLLLILGVSCIIRPLNYNFSYNTDLIILFVASLILMIIPTIGKKDYMTKSGGLLFLLSYLGYMLHLIIV